LKLISFLLLPPGRLRGGPSLILPPKQGDRGGLLHLLPLEETERGFLPPGRLRGGLLFFRLEEPRFFLSEKESLIRDNGISCKAVCMLAYKQNYN